MYYNEKGKPCILTEEQCFNCKHQYTCPLMQLVYDGFLTVHEEFSIINCPFYSTKLKRIK